MEIRAHTTEQEAELLESARSRIFWTSNGSNITPGELQETVVARANADGGEAVIGLDDEYLCRTPVDRFHELSKS